MSSQQLFKASGRIMRKSPVVSQWPWTSGIPLAGCLDDEVDKQIMGIGACFLETIRVHRLLLANMVNTDHA